MDRQSLIKQFQATRDFSRAMVEPLERGDFNAQPMPDVSPPKWNIAHTTWFLEQAILRSHEKNFHWHNERFPFCFNSYYEGFGPRLPRHLRGTLLRPTVNEVFDYRQNVDGRMIQLLEKADEADFKKIAPLVELGIHHEQQHQELFFGEIKFSFFSSPIRPMYRVNGSKATAVPDSTKMSFLQVLGGINEFGYNGEGFCYDIELPCHTAFVQSFNFARRLVTNGEYLEFMLAGGYKCPRHWLSDGWRWLQEDQVTSPLYWEKSDGKWYIYTLSGERELDLNEPVCHVSYYEADAYAKWAGKRLSTEHEWELVAGLSYNKISSGNYAEDPSLHPLPVNGSQERFQQLFGHVWEWTSSPFVTYPRFQSREGVLSEYNGKFASGQMVLRGYSCATPKAHATRETYRNFWPPPTQWQFTGIRLAADIQK